jgi:hypothetical protein
MRDARFDQTLTDRLLAYGSDFSRWTPEIVARARAALLAEPPFRRAWEKERSLDLALLAGRESLDAEIARSGAGSRIRKHLLARLPGDPLAGMRWRSVAAAILVAGMLGGLVDLALPEAAAESSDIAMFDPLDEADVR